MCAYRENYIYQLTNGSIVCVYDDLTEKKKLENELKVSQERYNLAIKFTPDGGLIEIIGEASPEGTRISIRDNGVGIKKENLEKLFRVDNNFSTNGTNNEEGTGLGLVLCKEFIHKNHGKYSIESEPGKGTTFSFVLPAKEMQSMEKSA
jgi:signal transduction histidine kinase